MIEIAMEKGKKNAALRAVEAVKDGMRLGIGTGSTVHYFIQALIEKVGQGLNIEAVASSEASKLLAQKGGIPLMDEREFTMLDLTVDGADEIDAAGRMIKGGGGALCREKILASSSKDLFIIVDASKVVKKLGKRKLPVEILPFGLKATVDKIEKCGFKGALRKGHTDNGNVLFDITLPSLLANPEETHNILVNIPGVVETGLFFHVVKKVFVGHLSGTVEEHCF